MSKYSKNLVCGNIKRSLRSFAGEEVQYFHIIRAIKDQKPCLPTLSREDLLDFYCILISELNDSSDDCNKLNLRRISVKNRRRGIRLKTVYVRKEVAALNKQIKAIAAEVKSLILETGRVKAEDIEIKARAKSPESLLLKLLFDKLQTDKKLMDIRKLIKKNIFDLYGMRILINPDNKNLCYTIYEIMTQLFQPMPQLYKDFILSSKKNDYQTLQWTVMTRTEKKIEIQIRTKKMHDTAESGVASHGGYKSGYFRNPLNQNVLESLITLSNEKIKNYE